MKRTSSLRIGWIPDPPVIEVLCRFTNISVKTAGAISKRSFLVTIHRQIVVTVTVETWRSNSLCLRLQDLLQVTWQNKVVGAAALRSPACAVGRTSKSTQIAFQIWVIYVSDPEFPSACNDVIAVTSITSSTEQPRERSLAGFFNPWRIGPIARAAAKRSVSL